MFSVLTGVFLNLFPKFRQRLRPKPKALPLKAYKGKRRYSCEKQGTKKTKSKKSQTQAKHLLKVPSLKIFLKQPEPQKKNTGQKLPQNINQPCFGLHKQLCTKCKTKQAPQAKSKPQEKFLLTNKKTLCRRPRGRTHFFVLTGT